MIQSSTIVLASVVRLFADDVIRTCDACGRRVYLRPRSVGRWRLICVFCWTPSAGDYVVTTPEDVREFLLYTAPTDGAAH